MIFRLGGSAQSCESKRSNLAFDQPPEELYAFCTRSLHANANKNIEKQQFTLFLLRGNHPKGHHKGANARKIYEKRKIIQEASKAYTNEKSTKKKNEKLCASKDPTPIGRKINATNPGPLKILEETKKTKNFSFSRKIHEKSKSNTENLTKNELSC